MTGEELGERLGLHPRAIYDFLDTLVALRFLERDGDGPRRRATATRPRPRRSSTSDSPAYIGGILEMGNARLYRFWGDLTEALRTGQPQNEVKHTGTADVRGALQRPGAARAVHGRDAGHLARATSTRWRRSSTSPSTRRCATSAAPPASSPRSSPSATRICSCTSFDLPVVDADRRSGRSPPPGCPIASTAASGDFFADPLPQADVITMGMILHDWNLDGKMHLIRSAYDALPDGGAFIAIENLIDDARRENAFGLMMSLNMLIEFGDAFDYTGADFAGWCREVGFREVEILPLDGPGERRHRLQVAAQTRPTRVGMAYRPGFDTFHRLGTESVASLSMPSLSTAPGRNG